MLSAARRRAASCYSAARAAGGAAWDRHNGRSGTGAACPVVPPLGTTAKKGGRRALSTSDSHTRPQPTALLYLYPDPPGGYDNIRYLREPGEDALPLAAEGGSAACYPDGQRLPAWPSSSGVAPPLPGALLGCVSGELGLRALLTEELGVELIVTCDEKEAREALGVAQVVVSQPFWPLYLDSEALRGAENLELVVTAGVGSDHTDLAAARELGIDVVEITQSNSSSVAEHAVMQALSLVRNFLPSRQRVIDGEWDIAGCVSQAYDVLGMHVGTVGCGRIGHGVLERMAPFVGPSGRFMYTEQHKLPPKNEAQLGLGKGAHYFSEVAEMVPHCDVVFVNAPLTAQTDGLFDRDMISRMRRGAYLINTARGRICDAQAVTEALDSGQLGGYAGDVWYPQPAPIDHPWRSLSRGSALTPHVSGTTLSAQARYATGVAEVLHEHFVHPGRKRWPEVYNVVKDGERAGVGARSYSEEALEPIVSGTAKPAR